MGTVHPNCTGISPNEVVTIGSLTTPLGHAAVKPIEAQTGLNLSLLLLSYLLDQAGLTALLGSHLMWPHMPQPPHEDSPLWPKVSLHYLMPLSCLWDFHAVLFRILFPPLTPHPSHSSHCVVITDEDLRAPSRPTLEKTEAAVMELKFKWKVIPSALCKMWINPARALTEWRLRNKVYIMLCP
jgi:hypothetical protein